MNEVEKVLEHLLACTLLFSNPGKTQPAAIGDAISRLADLLKTDVADTRAEVEKIVKDLLARLKDVEELPEEVLAKLGIVKASVAVPSVPPASDAASAAVAISASNTD